MVESFLRMDSADHRNALNLFLFMYFLSLFYRRIVDKRCFTDCDTIVETALHTERIQKNKNPRRGESSIKE